MDQTKLKQGLRPRITLVLLILMFFMAAVISGVSYYAFRSTYLRFYDDKAQQMVRIAAERTKWEKIADYAETGETDEYVKDLLDFYDNMKISAYSPLYLYLFVPGKDSFTYLYLSIRISSMKTSFRISKPKRRMIRLPIRIPRHTGTA